MQAKNNRRLTPSHQPPEQSDQPRAAKPTFFCTLRSVLLAR